MIIVNKLRFLGYIVRGGSRAAVTSKMERFVIIVNGWKPLTIITKRFILDVAAVLDPPLIVNPYYYCYLYLNSINLLKANAATKIFKN